MLWINTFFLLSLVVWMGGMIFFASIGAPTIFKTLPPEEAGKVIGAIFPKYFPMGYFSGFTAFTCLLISAIKTGHWPYGKILLLIVMLTFQIYNGLMSYPRAQTIKEEIQHETEQENILLLQKEFKQAHRSSVINNMIVLLIGIFLIMLTARQLTL